MTCLWPQSKSGWQMQASNLGPDAQPALAGETKGTEEVPAAQKEWVIWKG